MSSSAEVAIPENQQLEQLQQLVEDLLSTARKQGADAAEASISVDQGLSVTARLGEVETIEHHRDQGLGVSVYFGQRKGSASTTLLTQEAIQDTVKAACDIARYAAEDPYAGLPDADNLATVFPDLQLYHPWSIDADQAVELALSCEQAAMDYHPDIQNSEGASVVSHRGLRLLGNSHGFVHGYPSTRHSISCSVIGKRGDSMQRDYWFTQARRADALASAVSVGEQAAKRTIERIGAKSMGTRSCPVLYSAQVSAGLIGHFIGAIRGGNLYRKSSFLLDSVGQPVFPEFVRIHEQPLLKQALGSSAYDAEGVATMPRDIVTAGVVQGYVLNSYSARKLGLKTTANAGGVHNLTVEPGEQDFDDLLKTMDTGFVVTELMGQGVNILTGDYSRGASGFWVEGGKIQYPVEEVTIAGNLRDMYQNIVAIGRDLDTRGSSTRCGSILINQMTLAGQ